MLSDEDFPSFLFRLDKLSSTLRKEIHSAIEEMRVTIEHAILSGVMRPIYVTPLMLGSRHDYFKNGVCFEVCKRNKRHDLLAAGGRYVRLWFDALEVYMPIEHVADTTISSHNSLLLRQRPNLSAPSVSRSPSNALQLHLQPTRAHPSRTWSRNSDPLATGVQDAATSMSWHSKKVTCRSGLRSLPCCGRMVLVRI